MRYFLSFEGRLGRGEFLLILFIAWLPMVGIITFVDFLDIERGTFAFLLINACLLALALVEGLYVSVSACVRRLHDMGFSGWCLFFAVLVAYLLHVTMAVPYGKFCESVVSLLSVWPGDVGPNRFGSAFGRKTTETQSSIAQDTSNCQPDGRIKFKL